LVIRSRIANIGHRIIGPGDFIPAVMRETGVVHFRINAAAGVAVLAYEVALTPSRFLTLIRNTPEASAVLDLINDRLGSDILCQEKLRGPRQRSVRFANWGDGWRIGQ
jgi:hypothetical protein